VIFKTNQWGCTYRPK